MTIPSTDLDTEVEVRSYTGEGGYGAVYAEPVTTVCNLDATRRLVRNGQGDEVVAEMTLRLDPDQGVDVETVFQPESLVTVRGRQARVITVSPFLDRGALLHLLVTTT